MAKDHFVFTNDDAFGLLPEGLIDQLLEDPTGDLTLYLLIMSTGNMGSDLSNGMMVPTLAGTELTVSLMNGMVQIDNACNADIETGMVVFTLLTQYLFLKKMNQQQL